MGVNGGVGSIARSLVTDEMSREVRRSQSNASISTTHTTLSPTPSTPTTAHPLLLLPFLPVPPILLLHGLDGYRRFPTE